MAICNTVRPRKDGSIFAVFKEDLAVVEAAEEYGVSLVSRNQHSCVLECKGVEQEFNICGVRNFSQESKISGIVLQHESGTGTLYLKGELRCIRKSLDASIRESVVTQAKEFASRGLRTIVLCQRKLGETEL
jgi:magnesium-transporting ATPase (P-type)